MTELGAAFHDAAGWYRTERGKIGCWLWLFDERKIPCSGRLEAIHLIGRQRIRNRLYGVDPELVELAEWDGRNAACGCTQHHRRFDSHATPPLRVPVHALRREALEFVTEKGLEADCEAKFTGNLELALELTVAAQNPSGPPPTLCLARVQPRPIFAGQPSA